MLEAVVFDFDGLILDTETPEFESWGEVFADMGAQLQLHDWIACVGAGPQAWSVFDHLESLLGHPVDRAAVGQRWRARRDALVANLVPLPGVLDLMDSLDKANTPFGIASSSERSWVEGHLHRLGLRPRFKLVLTRDDHPPKPAPDLYMAAAAGLGGHPSRTAALEDSLNGIRASKSAGLFAVAVPNPITQASDFALADKVLPSLQGVSAQTLASWLSAS